MNLKIKTILLLVVLMTGLSAMAQNRKITFQSVSLQEALKQAKAQHKMVFLDCYTEWCVPCKQMAAYVFTLDSVADFFNNTFINVKEDMEKGEGPAIGKMFSVGAFPSYILLDGDGKLQYKCVGGMPANEFMGKIKSGMNPDNEVAKMNAHYTAGDRSPDLMREMILMKIRTMEIAAAKKLNDELMDALKPEDKVKPENWVLFGTNRYSMYLSREHSRNFSYLADHWQDFAAQNNIDTVNHKLAKEYRQIASYCLEGYYFKDHPFNQAEFDQYKKQLRSTTLPDKDQLLVMIEVAQAAGEKKTDEITALLDKNVEHFSEENLRIMWGYYSMCSLISGYKYKGSVELADKVLKTTKSPFLTSTTEFFKQDALKKAAERAVN